MGFSFAAFFFFVLITRTTGLDYDSESSPPYPVKSGHMIRRDRRPRHLSAASLPAVCLAVSAMIGVVGGVLLVMSWWRFGSIMACVVVVGLMLGFLIASTVLFTPLGTDVFKKKPPSGPLTRVHHQCV